MNDRSTSIVVFGDQWVVRPHNSTNPYYRRSFSWQYQLEMGLRRKGMAVSVRNAGIRFDTTRHGLDRMDDDVLSYRPDYVILSFCLGDSQILKSEKPALPISVFERNIHAMIGHIQSAGSEVILVTPPPLPRFYATPFGGDNDRWFYQFHGRNYDLAQRVHLLRDMARKHRLPLIDCYAQFDSLPDKGESMLDSDGGPNCLGCQWFARYLVDEFMKRARKSIKRSSSRRAGPVWIAFGDSVTDCMNNYVDRQARTWRRRIEAGLRKTNPFAEVRNSGVPCDRVIQAIERLDADALAYKPDYVFVCFGLNDAWVTLSNRIVISPQCYRRTLLAIVRKIRRAKAVPILISPNPLTWKYGWASVHPSYKAKGLQWALEQHVDQMASVARHEKTLFIDVFHHFLQHRGWPDELVPDGLHPGKKGCEAWAQLVLDSIRPLTKQ